MSQNSIILKNEVVSALTNFDLKHVKNRLKTAIFDLFPLSGAVMNAIFGRVGHWVGSRGPETSKF